MSLQATVAVQRGGLALRVALEVQPGEVVALLGPNGAGKTTLLRVLGGLAPLESGCISLAGRVLDDPGTGVFVPPEQRSVGMVFQEYLLFPHLSALENVAFGLRARGTSRPTARAAAAQWLDRVGIGELADQRPGRLSGGQCQRVALARALAVEPQLLALDEPLAALDARTRGEVRRELRAHLDGFAGSCVVVTHDPVDAYALADRVVVIEEGRVVQEGSLADVAAHPRSRYVAELAGINLLSGVMSSDGVFTGAGGATVVIAGDDAVAGPAFASIRPQAISLHREQPEGSQRNAWLLTVVDIDQQHDRVRVRLAGAHELVAEITPAALAAMKLRPGESVWAAAKATEVHSYVR